MEERSTSNVHRQRCHRGRSVNLGQIIGEAAAVVETEEILIKVVATSSKVSKDFHLNSSSKVNRTTHRTTVTTSSNLLVIRIIKVNEVEADHGFRAVGIKATTKASINEDAGVGAEVAIKVPFITIQAQK